MNSIKLLNLNVNYDDVFDIIKDFPTSRTLYNNYTLDFYSAEKEVSMLLEKPNVITNVIKIVSIKNDDRIFSNSFTYFISILLSKGEYTLKCRNDLITTSKPILFESYLPHNIKSDNDIIVLGLNREFKTINDIF